VRDHELMFRGEGRQRRRDAADVKTLAVGCQKLPSADERVTA
jgi:hypothetical protein